MSYGTYRVKRYVAVWSLQRGCIHEPLDLLQCANAQASEEHDALRGRIMQYERDAPLTPEQMWREQGISQGYTTRKGVRRAQVAKERAA